MTLRIADRIWDVTSTVGTGTVTLSNTPPLSYSTFGSVCSDGDTIYYALSGQTANVWEVGLGTYHTSGPTLVRTSVIASSSGGGTVTLAGVSNVQGVWPASQLNLFTSTVQGFVPASGGGTANFLRADGGWALPPPGTDWINVKTFGATGNGSTDDTTAINSAIGALNSAGAGVLYFPAGTYLVTSALTTITALGMCQGDGAGFFDQTNAMWHAATTITTASTSIVVFTINSKYFKFNDLMVINTATLPISTSAGIKVLGSNYSQRVDYESIVVTRFYINVDVQVGDQWTMDNCHLADAVQYCLRIQNTVANDAGDWNISNSSFYAWTRAFQAGIHQDSSGGGKIVNCKWNSGYVNGYEGGPSGSSILLISNCSIENFTGIGIYVSGGGGLTVISNIEFLATSITATCINAGTSNTIINNIVMSNLGQSTNPGIITGTRSVVGTGIVNDTTVPSPFSPVTSGVATPGMMNLVPGNAGTFSSGTLTPTTFFGDYQYLTNSGAFTIATPATDCAMQLLVTNSGTAGAITFSGYSVSATPGDALDTTNGHKFLIAVFRINGVSTYHVQALQ